MGVAGRDAPGIVRSGEGNPGEIWKGNREKKRERVEEPLLTIPGASLPPFPTLLFSIIPILFLII